MREKLDNENTAMPFRHESENSTSDSREEDLIAAKRLCDIPEGIGWSITLDEIRNKSKREIRELISTLSASLAKIQDQANYWLDAKEQLVMESEMHNKMIASLVLARFSSRLPMPRKNMQLP